MNDDLRAVTTKRLVELFLIDAADWSSEPQTRTTAPFRGKPNGPDTVPGPVPGPELSAGLKCVIGQKNNS